MSASFEIESSHGRYQVRIEAGLFARFLTDAATAGALIFADERFASATPLAGYKVLAFHASEANKTLAACSDVILQLRQRGLRRDSTLLVIGGGILQDVGTFCASVFMRGIPWTYLPTTLLGMADSCIGGKSSINLGDYKNIVGTYHPPRLIVIDPELALTLPVAQFTGGLIEAAKICFARGEAAFDHYLSLQAEVGMDVQRLESVVHASLLAKKWFIETDEFDQGERLLLNFGHTFGHALEGASSFRINHGLAVGIGMLCALDFAAHNGVRDDGTPRVAALRTHITGLLRGVPGLAPLLRQMRPGDLMDRFLADKKHRTDTLVYIGPGESGHLALMSLPNNASGQEKILNCFKVTLNELADEIQ